MGDILGGRSLRHGVCVPGETRCFEQKKKEGKSQVTAVVEGGV